MFNFNYTGAKMQFSFGLKVNEVVSGKSDYKSGLENVITSREF